MRLFLAFLIGVSFGNWLNGPEAYDRGLRWGKWTREFLGLPPLDQQPTREPAHKEEA